MLFSRTTFRSGIALGCVGSLILGAALGGGGPDQLRGGDPTVGTLPRVAAPPSGSLSGLDQFLYLSGDTIQIRRALDAVDADAGVDGAGYTVTPLPGGRVWVEFLGEFRITWSDPSILEGIEIGIGTGLLGGGQGEGIIYSVETFTGTSSPAKLSAGGTLAIDPARLSHAGLFARPIVVHGAHGSGDRTRLEMDMQGGALTIRQGLEGAPRGSAR